MGSGSLVQLGLLGLIAIIFITLGAKAEDLPFAIHMFIFAAAAIVTIIYLAKTSHKPPADKSGYLDGVVKAGAIMTVFWGVVGFLVGVVVALQLAFPAWNPDLEWFNFGRLRPLHTSAVIFAFGGTALLTTSFYVVQRTCRTRLAFGNLGWFVFWGYQLFIVLAATGYLLGATEGREYAEPEWYVDLWITVVWVAYFLVFFGTLIQRKEPHIYVANWFYLSFIVTIAMLHIVNNLSIPVSFLGSKSYSAFAGVQDALTQWWYGHNAVGFFL
ncbi:MAG: cbb3-type cytochrome c oxidase subunit I, partial [Alphaproteobacteria bacterium]|nr:cbb3-type cytochrome c oxidase subunit I [Alphaproteobacteria bacterium]